MWLRRSARIRPRQLKFIKDNGRTALILEDCGGMPLRRLIGERKHGMADELSLFLRLPSA